MPFQLALGISLVIAAITVFAFLWMTFFITKVRAAARLKPPRIRPGSTVVQVMEEAEAFDKKKWSIVKGAAALIIGTFLLTLIKI
jgi:hypothetical protein